MYWIMHQYINFANLKKMTATKSLLARAGLYLSAKEFRYIIILIDNTAIYQLL